MLFYCAVLWWTNHLCRLHILSQQFKEWTLERQQRMKSWQTKINVNNSLESQASPPSISFVLMYPSFSLYLSYYPPTPAPITNHIQPTWWSGALRQAVYRAPPPCLLQLLQPSTLVEAALLVHYLLWRVGSCTYMTCKNRNIFQSIFFILVAFSLHKARLSKKFTKIFYLNLSSQ